MKTAVVTGASGFIGRALVREVAIATIWLEFADVKDKTKAPVVDCRYML